MTLGRTEGTPDRALNSESAHAYGLGCSRVSVLVSSRENIN